MQLVDVSSELSPYLKYRPGLLNWKVFHKGKGQKIAPVWYQTYTSVHEHKKKAIKETMFTDTYTMFNNEEERTTEDMKADPLNLKRCLRLYP